MSNDWTDNLLSGSISGAVTRLVVSPFDVIKIRFQLQDADNIKYTSFTQAARSILREEGFAAFWKGNAAAQLMVVPYCAVSFMSYESSMSFLKVRFPESTWWHSFVSGGMAGACATAATFPFDLLRTRFAAQHQLGSERPYKSLIDACSSIVNREGPLGLYRGMSLAMLGVLPYQSLQFVLYDNAKRYLLVGAILFDAFHSVLMLG